ncbi:MAG: hypothetical protein MMC23_005591 [Stictis urceolatum]|nr:hypothetical protein [Stictis urceolata]
MLKLSKTFLSLIACITSTGAYIADWNATHIYNPHWPPHAKFHNGQTMSLGLTLGMLTLFILWRPLGNPKDGLLRNSKDAILVQRERLQYASLVVSLYWVTQASAVLYPGALAMDPEFGTGNPQVWLDTVLLGVVGGAYWVGVRELRGVEDGGKRKM